MIQNNGGWLLVLLLFVGVLVALGLPSPVSAFKLVEHATCKDIGVPRSINASTAMLLMMGTLVPTCRERTSEFLTTDEVAWFLAKGMFESSDLGLKVLFKFYDAHHQLFAVGPSEDQNQPISDVSPPDVLLAMPLLISSAEMEAWILVLGKGETAVYHHTQQEPAARRLGEWLAELTLDGRIVVSERFKILEKTTTTATTARTTTTVAASPYTTALATTVTTPIVTGTQTQPSAASMPFAIVLPATVIVVVVSVGLTLLVRRRRARTKISPSPSTSG